jgi:hypothetical protein
MARPFLDERFHALSVCADCRPWEEAIVQEMQAIVQEI